MGRSPTQFRAQRHARPLSPSGVVLAWIAGLLVLALVLFALGFGVSASAVERRAVTDGETAVATVPMVSGAVAANTGAKATTAVLGHTWTLVALELVTLVGALTTVFAAPRRAGSSWLRAPPVVLG
jgi:hypothetical protein